ncbi:MAG: rRNA maturation RNase YbeY [Varibaculum sp.]|nr:rRNA maturation RNase YbeY [Varibaculum sp.]
MSVEIVNETEFEIDDTEFLDAASYCMRQLQVHPDAELAVLFVDEEAMAELHKRWMNLDGPTDVMSFPMDELRPGHPEASGILGDIVICPQVAEAQAAEAKHTLAEEMLLLMIHGLLHLLGYDHMRAGERAEMFALQRRLFLTFLAQK